MAAELHLLHTPEAGTGTTAAGMGLRALCSRGGAAQRGGAGAAVPCQRGGPSRVTPVPYRTRGPAASHLSRRLRPGRHPRTFSIPTPRQQEATATRPLQPLRTRPKPARGGDPREGPGRAGLMGPPANRRSARRRSPIRVPRGGATLASGQVRTSRWCPQVRGVALSLGARRSCGGAWPGLCWLIRAVSGRADPWDKSSLRAAAGGYLGYSVGQALPATAGFPGKARPASAEQPEGAWKHSSRQSNGASAPTGSRSLPVARCNTAFRSHKSNFVFMFKKELWRHLIKYCSVFF